MYLVLAVYQAPGEGCSCSSFDAPSQEPESWVFQSPLDIGACASADFFFFHPALNCMVLSCQRFFKENYIVKTGHFHSLPGWSSWDFTRFPRHIILGTTGIFLSPWVLYTYKHWQWASSSSFDSVFLGVFLSDSPNRKRWKWKIRNLILGDRLSNYIYTSTHVCLYIVRSSYFQ